MRSDLDATADSGLGASLPAAASLPPAEGARSGGPLRDALRPAGPAQFSLSTKHEPDAVVVRVAGELDVLTVPKLAARLDEVIRGSTADVMLDLRTVNFMDSAGLQLLMKTRRRLLRTTRTMIVICDDGPVKQVIELARLTDALGVTTP